MSITVNAKDAQANGDNDTQTKRHKKSSKAKGKEPDFKPVIEDGGENGDLGKSKKLKKEKRKHKEVEAEDDAGVSQGDEDSAALKAKRKEEKRLKKEMSKALEKAGDSKIDGASEAVEKAVVSEKRHKKDKKRKNQLEEQVAGTVDLAAEDTDERKAKRKKVEVIVDDGVQENDSPVKKKEKKKRKPKAVADSEGKDSSANEASGDNPSFLNGSGPSTSARLASPSEAEVSEYLSKHSISIDTGLGPDSPLPSALRPILLFSQLFPRIPAGLHGAVSTFNEPTPIQACTWPAVLEGRDVVGIAETGSGKTLAFGIPAVSRLVEGRRGQASHDSTASSKKNSKAKRATRGQIEILAIAPTRELAIQTHETFTSLGAPFGLKSVALYGGVDKGPQRQGLAEAGAAMVVGTPGRILDLLEEGAVDLTSVNFLILDEADRMLDKGFENDIRRIISKTAAADHRQTLMFSATWPEAVRRLASTFQKKPVRVTVGSDDLTANSRVEQVVEVFDDQREKDARLVAHLRTLKARKGGKQNADEARILIFVLYKKEASRVEETLRRQGYSVGGIHGDLSQAARIAALEDFKSGKTQLLVATDVAARGLDIPNVGTVINYSFPLTLEDYIHRIGRTGRGGKSGKSITFFTGDNHERALAGELAKVLRESGFDADPLKRFPMTIKKKTHSVYGAFYRDDIPTNAVPTRMKFD